MKFHLTFLIVAVLLSCNNKGRFSDEERIQARYFLEAQNFDNKAAAINNSGPNYQRIPPDQVQEVLALQEAALASANKIPNNVLKKIHPDLPEQYVKYKEGHRLRILNLTNPEGDVLSEIAGFKLLDNFHVWFNENKNQIRIPKSR